MVEQGREDGQQCYGDVVDALADALHLGAGLHEFAQLQHLQQFFQVLRCVLEEGPESGFDQLRAGLHDRPERATRETCKAAEQQLPGWWVNKKVGLPGVERVCEDVQAAHHHCRVTSWREGEVGGGVV